MMPELTPFQTIGPFFHGALARDDRLRLIAPQSREPRLVIHGSVRDGVGEPVSDALLELWQADASGRYPTAPSVNDFDGFGRVATEADGSWWIETIRPGPAVDATGAVHAPQLLVQIFARGILSRLVTRIYFEGDPYNAQDPVLLRVPAERRATLLACARQTDHYRFDIVLQGPGETVFFDV